MTIIDVRTPGEFMGGHVEGSINISIRDIPTSIEDIKVMEDVVVCCASGIRSMQAVAFLSQNGVKAEDGGSWFNLVNNSKKLQYV